MPQPPSKTATRLAEASLPALLRAGRAAYSGAVRAALVEAGCEDLPRNGPYVISAILRIGPQLGEIIAELGVSKQAAGQLVDALVQRGYLEREADPDDRRRYVLALTQRGKLAAKAVRKGVAQVDQQIEARLGPAAIKRMRRALLVLSELASLPPQPQD
jgi:DNA-binding MarR family transcriptional regulator